MSRSNAALPTTLKSVTSIKIGELKKQRKEFEETRKSILAQANKCSNDIEKASKLLDGVCGLEGVPVPDDDSSDDEDRNPHLSSSTNVGAELLNKRLILRLAAKDPAFPSKLITKHEKDLLRDIELRRVRHEHAELYSELVTDWLSGQEEQTVSKPVTEADGTLQESEFESVGRKEMHEQRAQWESLVFTEADTDTAKIDSYMNKLFNDSKVMTQELDVLRKQIGSFCKQLQFEKELFNAPTLKSAISGLIATDLLSEEKVAILKTFQTNTEVLTEVSDVLNMRFRTLETWSWTTNNGALTLEMRKQLNGRYRVFVDEDVLDALLTHQLGIRWAVQLKSSFNHFYNSQAWHRTAKGVVKTDQRRREYFLGESNVNVDSINNQRQRRYKENYFMTQLPDTITEGAREYNGMSDDDDAASKSTRKSPVETKHGLLHLLMAEVIVARHLRPNATYTVIRSDFEWFGPSLPHSTIFAVLKFYGVTDFWLGFFRRFLEMPVRFVQDGRSGEIRVRKRGVPMSNVLSDVFGEATLFVMDLAVNHATRTFLYRLHDDFWFWGSEDVCKQAWHAMSTFASTMGLKFNEEKTGTVSFRPVGHYSASSDSDSTENSDDAEDDDDETDDKAAASVSLPKGEVRWGFLRLDAAAVRFVIDQKMVDEHIKELKLQLSYCNSLFSYIQAYNAYFAQFFGNNFGKPSFGFGRQHIDMMIDTFARVQKAMFPEGSVTDHLCKQVATKFGVRDLPEGFWYWPVQMGGMDLRNPLIPLLAMRESMKQSPKNILKKVDEKEESLYVAAKERFEQSDTTGGLSGYHPEIARANADGKFMSREEFSRYREQRSAALSNAYQKLVAVPDQASVHETAEIKSWLESIPLISIGRDRGGRIRRDFNDMESYWQWILAIHGAEMIDKYGSVQLVDAGQVPLGVVSVMKAGKIRWRG